MKIILAAALLLLTLALDLHAQNVSPTEQETIRELLAEVKQLQEKVLVLEERIGTAPSPLAATPPAQAVPVDDSSSPESREFNDIHGIHWQGFGQVDYKVLDLKTPELGTYGFVSGSSGNFYTGDFDLLLTSRISDRASVLSEIVFGEEDAQRYSVDLERILLKYDYNDNLRISAGRYHTGIGYYNTAFHSGLWLQTTADRPLIMEYATDGGPLPTQAVGVSLTGAIPSGKLGLNYIAEYGSSDTVRPSLHGDGEIDESNGNNINVGLFARPDAIPGLQIGASIYHDRISDFSRGGNVRLGQTIVNSHVVYVQHGLELLNEAFLIRHDYEGSLGTYNMPAFYSQVSKRFGPLRPFLRYQYIHANAATVLSDIGLRHGPSFGARYDFSDSIAFKVQLDHAFRAGQPDINGLHLQLAFAF